MKLFPRKKPCKLPSKEYQVAETVFFCKNSERWKASSSWKLHFNTVCYVIPYSIVDDKQLLPFITTFFCCRECEKCLGFSNIYYYDFFHTIFTFANLMEGRKNGIKYSAGRKKCFHFPALIILRLNNFSWCFFHFSGVPFHAVPEKRKVFNVIWNWHWQFNILRDTMWRENPCIILLEEKKYFYIFFAPEKCVFNVLKVISKILMLFVIYARESHCRGLNSKNQLGILEKLKEFNVKISLWNFSSIFIPFLISNQIPATFSLQFPLKLQKGQLN